MYFSSLASLLCFSWRLLALSRSPCLLWLLHRLGCPFSALLHVFVSLSSTFLLRAAFLDLVPFFPPLFFSHTHEFHEQKCFFVLPPNSSFNSFCFPPRWLVGTWFPIGKLQVTPTTNVESTSKERIESQVDTSELHISLHAGVPFLSLDTEPPAICQITVHSAASKLRAFRWIPHTDVHINDTEEMTRIPEITTEELQDAINKLKKGKSPDRDGIRAEDIKACDDEIREMVRQIFNEIIKQNELTPEAWKKRCGKCW